MGQVAGHANALPAPAPLAGRLDPLAGERLAGRRRISIQLLKGCTPPNQGFIQTNGFESGKALCRWLTPPVSSAVSAPRNRVEAQREAAVFDDDGPGVRLGDVNQVAIGKPDDQNIEPLGKVCRLDLRLDKSGSRGGGSAERHLGAQRPIAVYVRQSQHSRFGHKLANQGRRIGVTSPPPNLRPSASSADRAESRMVAVSPLPRRFCTTIVAFSWCSRRSAGEGSVAMDSTRLGSNRSASTMPEGCTSRRHPARTTSQSPCSTTSQLAGTSFAELAGISPRSYRRFGVGCHSIDCFGDPCQIMPQARPSPSLAIQFSVNCAPSAIRSVSPEGYSPELQTGSRIRPCDAGAAR